MYTKGKFSSLVTGTTKTAHMKKIFSQYKYIDIIDNKLYQMSDSQFNCDLQWVRHVRV